MWKCKKCGGEIITDYANGSLDGGYGVITKDKNVDLVDYAIDFTVNEIFCEDCGASVDDIDELENIAVWRKE